MINILCIIFLLMIPLSSCSPDIASSIVGEWKGETLEQDFQFYENGSVELKDRKHSTYTGSYTIRDGNTLTCTFESFVFTEPVVRTVRISGDKLILKDKKGFEEIYIRK